MMLVAVLLLAGCSDAVSGHQGTDPVPAARVTPRSYHEVAGDWVRRGCGNDAVIELGFGCDDLYYEELSVLRGLRARRELKEIEAGNEHPG